MEDKTFAAGRKQTKTNRKRRTTGAVKRQSDSSKTGMDRGTANDMINVSRAMKGTNKKKGIKELEVPKPKKAAAKSKKSAAKPKATKGKGKAKTASKAKSAPKGKGKAKARPTACKTGKLCKGPNGAYCISASRNCKKK